MTINLTGTYTPLFLGKNGGRKRREIEEK